MAFPLCSGVAIRNVRVVRFELLDVVLRNVFGGAVEAADQQATLLGDVNVHGLDSEVEVFQECSEKRCVRAVIRLAVVTDSPHLVVVRHCLVALGRSRRRLWSIRRLPGVEKRVRFCGQ